METGSEGGMEAQGGPHPGLDWIALDAQIRRQERADWGKAAGGSWPGLLLPPGRAHSSLRSPATPVEAGIQSVTRCNQPGVGNESPKPRIGVNQ